MLSASLSAVGVKRGQVDDLNLLRSIGTDCRVHVGFRRPALPLVMDIVSHNGGWVLLAEAMRCLLDSRRLRVQSAKFDGSPIFVGLQGWGHASPSVARSSIYAVAARNSEPEGWVQHYVCSGRM